VKKTFTLQNPMENSNPIQLCSASQKVLCLVTGLAMASFAGCSSGVAPSRTATGAGVGAMGGAVVGNVVGANSSMGSGMGTLGGALAGGVLGGVVGMVQDARDRKEQDRLAQERAYQQENARKKGEEARMKAAMDEELDIAQGFRISDIELEDAKRKLDAANANLKELQTQRAAALAKKKDLDDTKEKTLAAEAEAARLQEELSRLKGEDVLLPRSSAPQTNNQQPPTQAKAGL
jgi:osmotically inducible lipoprotein OsmB